MLLVRAEIHKQVLAVLENTHILFHKKPRIESVEELPEEALAAVQEN